MGFAQVFTQALEFVFVQPLAAAALQEDDERGNFVAHIGAEPEEALPFVMEAGGEFAQIGIDGGVDADAAGVVAFDEADGQAQVALEAVEMAVEEADFVFVEGGGLQLGGGGEEQLGGVDDFAVGVLHGFHHGGADVAFARCGGEVAAAFDHAGVDLAHFDHVLLQPLAGHAFAVADFGNHFAAFGQVVGKHKPPHECGTQGQEFGGDDGDGGADEDVHSAHEAAVEPVVAVVADEHAHGQSGKHGDVAVFADRTPACGCAGGTYGQVKEDAAVEVVLVEPQQGQTCAQTDDRAEHAFDGFGVNRALKLEHAEYDEYGHAYPFAVLEVEEFGKQGGKQYGKSEPDGVYEAAVAVAFVGVEPAFDEAFAL